MDKRLKELIKAYANAQIIRLRAVKNYRRNIEVYNSILEEYKAGLNRIKTSKTPSAFSKREISLAIKRWKCQINESAKSCKEAKQIVKDSDKNITAIIELIDAYTSTDEKNIRNQIKEKEENNPNDQS
jgi:hypothetical protein